MPGPEPTPSHTSGRHIRSWKSLELATVWKATGSMGKMKLGWSPGTSAKLAVPPLAALTAAEPDVELVEELVPHPPPQAASARPAQRTAAAAGRQRPDSMRITPRWRRMAQATASTLEVVINDCGGGPPP